jgi:hypothetical protein
MDNSALTGSVFSRRANSLLTWLATYGGRSVWAALALRSLSWRELNVSVVPEYFGSVSFLEKKIITVHPFKKLFVRQGQ